MTEILYPARALDSPHAGGKARGLARMQRGGLTSPPWFVIPDTAFLDGSDERCAPTVPFVITQ